MGAQISQVQSPQGNQPVNPQYSQANYSPAQQQMGGKMGPIGQVVQDATNRAAPQFPVAPQEQYPVGAPMPREDGMIQNTMNANPQGKGGRRVMYSPTSNQPTMGQPNPYPNTIGQWDNASIQPQARQSGKGKGG